MKLLKLYCLLDLHYFGQNKHATIESDLSRAQSDGNEKPILFLSIEDAEAFAKQTMKDTDLHPCRWQ